MIVIESIEQLNDVIRYHNHESKKIGKLDINYNKIMTSEFYLHQGHIDCIKKLRESGCDYIMMECINSLKCFQSIQMSYSWEDNHMGHYLDYDENIKNVIDITQLKEYCKSLGIDYLIIDSDDYKDLIPKMTVDIVNDTIEKENYIKDLCIPVDAIKLLKVNLIVRTYRNSITRNGLTYVKSHKDGSWVFALKHYLKKYLNNDLIIIEPTMREDLDYPYSSSCKLKFNENIKIFLKYLNSGINLLDIDTIKTCASNLNIEFESKNIVNKKYFEDIFIDFTFSKDKNDYSFRKLI